MPTSASLKFPLPTNFVLDRRFKPLVRERLVGAFDMGQQPGEDLLRSKLTARGVDRESADHRLRHGDRDLPPALADLDGPGRPRR